MFFQNPFLKQKKILLVDDEPFNLMALHNILEVAGILDHKEICVEALNG